MNWRELIKTKTFWVGVLAIAGGIIECVFDGWDRCYEKILLGLGMIAGRHAVGKTQASVPNKNGGE
ncbi:MAG: hypothetical protein H6819_06780 [Phycisphaerales bacterium]|nr:hypothetical protein [Phycisphaerales bacterium]MCB9855286.1 hypothetical protein [Phycisphaerales bacterium]MCB9862879.1 hypothetical protein [Phycisphaerales bacterium]